MSIEIKNLKSVPKVGAIELTWEINEATNLGGFLVTWKSEGSISWYRAMLTFPSNSAILDYKHTVSNITLPTAFRVRPLIAGAAKEVKSTPLPAPTPTPEPAPTPAPSSSNLIISLDSGGWGGSSYADIVKAVKNVRFSSEYVTEQRMKDSSAAGITLACVLFGEGGTIGQIPAKEYAQSIVSHFKEYGKGGTFWAGKTDLGGRCVEVLNEPGGSWFWSDSTNYSGYTNLLKIVHEELSNNFASEIRPKILASWDGGGVGNKFGEEVKKLGGYNYCDGVTVHPYGGSSGQHGGALGNRQQVEDAYNLSKKPVYITEIGWPTATGKPSTGDSQQWTEAQQAENIFNFIKWCQTKEYIKIVNIFNYIDYGTNNYYGIEKESRIHKPSFFVLSLFL
jgi:hypothetical protein